jgi:acetyl-CoA C-acetyltransferase
VRKALEKARMTIGQIDVIELNEAFASVACACSSELTLDPAKTNPNGGAIALGHPVGATGAILVVKLMHELERTGGRYGIVSLCIGGGQGIATIFERLN